jgi:pyridoxine 5-phosphate synthase
MACVDAILALAVEIRPDQVTLVPERRDEVTTEGGLDLLRHREAVAHCLKKLQEHAILVSLFLDPDAAQLDAAAEAHADAVELHTGSYALARGPRQQAELVKLEGAARRVRELGLLLHAGHGLNYHNVRAVARIEAMHELNIGHSIVSRAVFVGLERAVREMKQLIG